MDSAEMLAVVLKILGSPIALLVLVASARRMRASQSFNRVYYALAAGMAAAALAFVALSGLGGAGALSGLLALLTFPAWSLILVETSGGGSVRQQA